MHKPLLFLLAALSVSQLAAAQSLGRLQVPMGVDTLPPVTITGVPNDRQSTFKSCDCMAMPVGCPSRQLVQQVEPLDVFTTIQPLLSRAAGVQVTPTSGAPGDWATVRIRGSGLRGNDQPLYLLDGLPALNADYSPGSLPLPEYNWGAGPQAVATAPNPLLFVAPADVSSVEVLKGAAATARYGSQGANGVIVITTRQGGQGGVAQAPRLRYEAMAGVQQVRRPVALLDARQYAELANEVWRNDGSRGPAPFDAGTLAALGRGTDWQGEVFQPALLQSHFMSLDGSTTRTRYLASANYLGQGGVVLGSQLRRYGLRLQAEHRFTARLTGQLRVSGAVLTRTLPSAATVPQALLAAPTIAATTGGEPTVTSGIPVVRPGYYAPFLNPLALARDAAATDRTRRLLVQTSLRYQLSPRWHLAANFSREQATTDATAQALVVAASSPAQPPVSSLASTTTLRLATTNAQLAATYNSPWIGRHQLAADASLLVQRTSREQQQTTTSAAGGIAWPGTTSVSDGAILGSALASGTYAFDQRLFFTALLRADQGQLTAYAGAPNRVQLYPGLTGRWDLSRERFWPASGQVLTTLRLTAALAQTSNGGLLASSPPFNLGALPARPYAVLPSDPRPRTTELNAELLLELWNGKLAVQPGYYRHATTQSGIAQLLPLTLTSDVLLARDVTLRNQGLELSVSSVLMKGEKVYCRLAFAAAHNQQTVERIEGSQPVPGLTVGEAVHPYYGYQRRGLDASGQLQYRDQNGDGVINAADANYFGQGLPSWLLNLSEQLTVGRFTLQTQFDALLGYQLLNPVLARLDQPTAATNASQRVLGRWTPTASGADVPRASFYQQAYFYDSSAPESASHLRLSQLTLSYRLPLPAPRQLRVWVGGQNLLVLSGYRGFDPNVSSGGSQGQLAGYDDSRYPVARVWQVGAQASF